MASGNGGIIRATYERECFRPQIRLDLPEGSEVRLEIVRIVRRHNNPAHELLEGDEVELRIAGVSSGRGSGQEASMKNAAGYPHITEDPVVRNGQPCIDDTGIAVADVVRLKRQGYTELEIFRKYPSLPSPGRIHAALAYYYDGHEAEVDAAITADEQAEAQAFSKRKRGIYVGRRRDKRARLKSR